MKVTLVGCWDAFNVEDEGTMDAEIVPPLYIAGLKVSPACTVANSKGSVASISKRSKSNSKGSW